MRKKYSLPETAIAQYAVNCVADVIVLRSTMFAGISRLAMAVMISARQITRWDLEMALRADAAVESRYRRCRVKQRRPGRNHTRGGGDAIGRDPRDDAMRFVTCLLNSIGISPGLHMTV